MVRRLQIIKCQWIGPQLHLNLLNYWKKSFYMYIFFTNHISCFEMQGTSGSYQAVSCSKAVRTSCTEFQGILGGFSLTKNWSIPRWIYRGGGWGGRKVMGFVLISPFYKMKIIQQLNSWATDLSHFEISLIIKRHLGLTWAMKWIPYSPYRVWQLHFTQLSQTLASCTLPVHCSWVGLHCAVHSRVARALSCWSPGSSTEIKEQKHQVSF